MKTAKTTLRISEKMKADLKEISEKIEFTETDLVRYLLKHSITKLKSDAIKSGGFDYLEITYGVANETN